MLQYTNAEQVVKHYLQIISFAVLLGGPFILGLLGLTAESGIVMLSGALGLAFINIDKIKRFKGGAFEAVMHEQFNALVAKESEPEEDIQYRGVEAFGVSLDEDTKKVMMSIKNSDYTWRALKSISNELSMDKSYVERILKWLESNGLALRVGISNRMNWGLTEYGREIAMSYISLEK